MMALICGITPEASELRRNISAYPASERTPFLDTRPARIVQADHRSSQLHRHIHNLANLTRICFGKGAAKDREVLGEDKNRAFTYHPVAGYHPVAQRTLFFKSELGATVGDELVYFDETSFFKEQFNTFTGSQFPCRMLLGDPVFSTT